MSSRRQAGGDAPSSECPARSTGEREPGSLAAFRGYKDSGEATSHHGQRIQRRVLDGVTAPASRLEPRSFSPGHWLPFAIRLIPGPMASSPPIDGQARAKVSLAPVGDRVMTGGATGNFQLLAPVGRRRDLDAAAQALNLQANERSSICSREEFGMPAARGSVIYSDLVDLHGDSLRCLIDAVADVTSDGLVTPDETFLLKNVIVLTRQSYEPLPVGASEQDDAFRAIGAISGAGKVTSRHVRGLINQAGMDAERQIA